MEVQTARLLLSTMIMVIPTVMSLALIALFAFPRSSSNWIRKRHIKLYHTLLAILIVLVGLSIISVLLDFSSLVEIDKIFADGNMSMFGIGLYLSLASLIFIPIYLTTYLAILSRIERER